MSHGLRDTERVNLTRGVAVYVVDGVDVLCGQPGAGNREHYGVPHTPDGCHASGGSGVGTPNRKLQNSQIKRTYIHTQVNKGSPEVDVVLCSAFL
jgi:hypothetical protein